jgi:hypothetical protein
MKKRHKILKENQGGGEGGAEGYSGLSSTFSGGGYYSTVGSSDLYKIFIQPFVDVVRVGAGGAKEIIRRGYTLANVVFQSLMTSLIPILGDTYKEVFEEEARDIAKIRSEYADVYKRSIEVLKSDAAALAFFTAPGAVITGLFVKRSPQIANSLLNTVTGRTYSTTSKSSRVSPEESGLFDSYNRSFHLLLGEDKKSELKHYLEIKKKVNNAVESSPIAGFLKRESTKIYKKTLENAFSEAFSVITAKKVEDIEKIIGKKLPEFDKIRDLPFAERMKEEQNLLSKMKESMKKLYIQPLLDRVKEARSSGISEQSPYIADHLDTIQKIQRL